MRIAMLNAELPPTSKSGVGYQVSRLANVLVERGHEVTVKSLGLSPADARYRLDSLYGHKFMRDNKLWQMTAVPIIFGVSRYRGYDLIHAHGDNPFLYRRSIPVVRTFYGAAREEARSSERLRRQLSQTLLRGSEAMGRISATLTVGISKNTAQAHGQLDFIIPCGVDRNRFRPGDKSPNPSILFVGTISGRKRGRFVVEIFREVIQRRFKDAELWLVADTPVTGEGIRSFGSVSDDQIADLFRTAWVFTLPSTYEGFGVPYIEAMASATPVVASANAGASELVQPSSGGLVGADDEIAELICTLIGDRKQRQDLGAKGRKASAAFDWNLIAASYEKVYKAAISRVRSVC